MRVVVVDAVVDGIKEVDEGEEDGLRTNPPAVEVAMISKTLMTTSWRCRSFSSDRQFEREGAKSSYNGS